MKTFKVENGDLVFDKQRNLVMVKDYDEEAQSIERLLTTNIGEWFLNVEHGLDYIRIQEKSISDEQIRLVVMQALTQEDRIAEVKNVDIVRNDKHRTAIISVMCKMQSGEVVGGSFLLDQPSMEFDPVDREYWFALPYFVVEKSIF